jgi:hypothetical protein
MKSMKNWKTIFLASSAAAMLISCTENNDDQPVLGESEVTISATVGNSEESPNARTNSLVYGNIAITDVRLSVDNVKLHLRTKSEDNKKPNIAHIKTNQPITLTLVKDGQVLVAPIASSMVAHGIYGKVDFDLVKAADVPETDEMYGYSVIAKATWFNIPAVMYLDLEDEVSMQFNKGLEVKGAQELLLTLYMDKFLEGVAPALVADGNSDGLIEVGPNNEDGNAEAYAAIKANIKEALVFKNGDFKNN